MITRPLYPKVERSPVSSGPELDPDPGCRLCRLHETARHPCLPADGVPGGVLLVGKHPGKEEDQRNRVFVGRTSGKLRKLVAETYDGPAVLDNVTRCFPGPKGQTAAHVAACRPYLRRVVRAAKPKRIIALGADAVLGLLGHSVPILSVRRGYGWLHPPGGDSPVPVFFVLHPAAAARNRFVARWFEADLVWALTTPDPPLPPWEAEVRVVETVEDSELAAEELRLEAPWFAYDVEWAGLPFGSYFEITVLAAVSSGVDDAWIWSRKALADPAVRRPLEELLADPSIGKVGHNLKGDNLAVRAAWGVTVRGSRGDTRLRRRLLEADVNGRLDVCDHLVGMGGHKAENDAEIDRAVRVIADAREATRSNQGDLFAGVTADRDPALVAAVELMPNEHPKRFAYALVPQEISDRYCARDAVATARLEDLLDPLIEEDRALSRVWDQIVSRATDAVSQMEVWGVAADRGAMETFDDYCVLELECIEDRLRAYDATFNPSSPDDVGKLLFETLGLPVVAKTEGGKPSTNKLVLERLRSKHPIVEDLVEYRRLEKLRSNYGRGLAEWIRDDGRIHPELKIDGTRTGRLSCVNPPLQTLPRGQSVEGEMIKRAFCAPPGFRIVQLDYSQIELRAAAFLSGDPVMISMFKSGEDFHTATAKLIAPIYWGIKADEVRKEHRSAAKAFNFGLIYGMTDHGLAKRLGCSLEEAARLRQAILGKWAVLSRWMQARMKETRRTGYARTWWAGEVARRRPLVTIASQDSKQKSGAENSSINTPVQGTASDFMLASICDIVDWILEDAVPAKLVLTVHDSVIFEVREDAVEEVILGATEIMQSHDSKGVPLKVDPEVGQSLGDLREWLPDAA